jgi:hypothetical protein
MRIRGIDENDRDGAGKMIIRRRKKSRAIRVLYCAQNKEIYKLGVGSPYTMLRTKISRLPGGRSTLHP